MPAPALPGGVGLVAQGEAPQVVISVHQTLLAGALARVMRRDLARDAPSSIEVITLDRRPDAKAVHVLRLPETLGDPAVLESPAGTVSLVLRSLDDVTDLVRDLLSPRTRGPAADEPVRRSGTLVSERAPVHVVRRPGGSPDREAQP